jgi:3-isopropylmalate dehydrogenase
MHSSAPTHRLAVLPGDGVGPELIANARRVLDALVAIDGLHVELEHFPHSAAHYHATGELLSDGAVERIAACDALLFGAAGDPSLPAGMIERALILDLSSRLGLSVSVRPAYLHSADLTPIKDLRRGDIDIAIVRDASEGELTLPGGTLHVGTAAETSASVFVHTRFAVDRTLAHAFALARKRRNKVSLVAQSNTLVPHQLWEQRLGAIGEHFPDVEREALYPDNAVAQLIRDPRPFDVVVTTLFLGGVLSDLVGALVGGIGLIASVRFNPVTGFGMYEPGHGSAYKYTGLDRVSPMATLNALAMLLDDRGEVRSAARLRWAIDHVLATGQAGLSTGSGVGTTAATDLVITALDHGDQEDAPR